MSPSQNDQSPSKIVARQVKKFRNSAGLTQAEVAAKCGIYRTYLSRIETGLANPTLDVLFALAITLNVQIFELLRETS